MYNKNLTIPSVNVWAENDNLAQLKAEAKLWRSRAIELSNHLSSAMDELVAGNEVTFHHKNKTVLVSEAKTESQDDDIDQLRLALKQIAGDEPWPDSELGYIEVARAALKAKENKE